MKRQGLRAESHNGALLFEPWQIATKQGGPYKVFTPFWRAGSAMLTLPASQDAPVVLPKVDEGPQAPESRCRPFVRHGELLYPAAGA